MGDNCDCTILPGYRCYVKNLLHVELLFITFSVVNPHAKQTCLFAVMPIYVVLISFWTIKSYGNGIIFTMALM